MTRNTLLESFYKEKYERLALRSRRPNTKRLYRTTLRFFNRYLNHPAKLKDLNDDQVSGFAGWRLESGLSKNSVNKDLFNLLAIWRWAHKKGYLTNWPDVALEVPPVRVPVALMQEEVDAVMASIMQEREPVGSVPGPHFWSALMLVIWDTGERIGAVMELTWECVDLKRGWVRFIAEDRKGAREDNLLPIADDTIAALKRISCDEGPVFRWPFFPTYIYNRLGKIMRRAGLPDNALFKFHVFRKSVASHFEAAGGNATELLKHSSRKVTRSYLDPRIVRRTAPIDVLFRPKA